MSMNLKNFRPILSNWNLSCLRKLEDISSNLHEHILVLENKESSSGLSESESTKMICLYNRLQVITRQINTKWWCKAKTTGINKGDRNNLITWHYRQNFIHHLKVNDAIVDHPKTIMLEFTRYYHNFWLDDNSLHPTHVWPTLSGIQSHEASNLIKPFS